MYAVLQIIWQLYHMKLFCGPGILFINENFLQYGNPLPFQITCSPPSSLAREKNSYEASLLRTTSFLAEHAVSEIYNGHTNL